MSLTLSEIETQFRGIVKDAGSKPLWSQTEAYRYANRVVNDICRQARVLRDGTTVTETLATGTITLSGTAGQVDSVAVNGVTVTSAAVPFNSTLTQTAADLAANITAFTSSPNYSATSALAVVTVSAASGTGSTPNGYEIAVTCSGGLSATVVDMANGSCLSRLFIVAGQQHYRKDPRIIDIETGGIVLDTLGYALEKKSYADFDIDTPTWETDTGDPERFCMDFTEGYISLNCIPVSADTGRLRIVRLPLRAMSATTDSPEIPEEYHDFIPEMMCRYAYDKKDSQTLDPQSAMKYYGMCYDLKNPESYMNQIINMERAKRPLRRPSGNGHFF